MTSGTSSITPAQFSISSSSPFPWTPDLICSLLPDISVVWLRSLHWWVQESLLLDYFVLCLVSQCSFSFFKPFASESPWYWFKMKIAELYTRYTKERGPENCRWAAQPLLHPEGRLSWGRGEAWSVRSLRKLILGGQMGRKACHWGQT
jgi:hypothetical protein